jgi:hypothetical protein
MEVHAKAEDNGKVEGGCGIARSPPLRGRALRGRADLTLKGNLTIKPLWPDNT